MDFRDVWKIDLIGIIDWVFSLRKNNLNWVIRWMVLFIKIVNIGKRRRFIYLFIICEGGWVLGD